MKKLNVLTVSLVAIMAVGAARAEIAAQSYVDTAVGTRVATDQGSTNANKAVITDANGKVTTGVVSSDMLAQGIKDSLALADSAVQESDLGDLATMNTVGTDQIDAKAVTKAKLADAVVASLELADSAVQDSDLGALAKKDTVGTDQIDANAVTAAKIANGTITTTQIAADAAIAKTQLASDVQTSLGLADSALQKDGTITAGHLLTTDSNGKIIDAGAKGALAAKDAVGTNDIDDKAVTRAKLADAVQASLALADSAVQDSDLGALAKKDTVGTDDIAANAVTAAKIANGTITTTQIAADAAIAKTQLASDVQTSLATLASMAPGDCGSADIQCVLTYNGSAYVWEKIGR